MAFTDHTGDDRWGPEQRISRQLHDLVVPQLFVVSTGLTALRRRVAGEPSEELVADLLAAAEEALADLRAISRGQHANDTKDFGRLVLRLELTATSASRLTGRAVEFACSGELDEVPTGLEDDLAAVARECTTNAIRHGDAGRVGVELRIVADSLSLVVTDDGRWVESTDANSSGLDGLRRRAASWQGRVVVDHGDAVTRVLWRIPLDVEGRPLVGG
jgi:signal transduction histidine kinase